MSSFTDKLFGKATSFIDRLDAAINGSITVDNTDPKKTTGVIKPNIVERIQGVPEITQTITRRPKEKSKEPAQVIKPSVSKRDPLIDAIAFNETRGIEDEQKKYQYRKPSGTEGMGDDIGKYQITTAELEAWGDDIMGRPVNVEEFAKSPELQDEYIEKKLAMIRRDVPGITDEEILAIHRGGLTGYADPKVRKKKVKDRQEYVESALTFLRGNDEV